MAQKNEEMTPEERRLANLKPFKKGQSGNPAGRPKGVKNWSTVIKQLLADEELLDRVMKKKPSYWEGVPQKNAANMIAIAMMIKAMEGDHRAATWINKSAFGDKLTVDAEDGLFQTSKIEVEIVKSKNSDVGDSSS